MGVRYTNTDAALIDFCANHEYHYSSTTAVVGIIHFPSNLLVVANLGDSHLVVGRRCSPEDTKLDSVPAQILSVSHRADDPMERQRIETAGGQNA